MIRVAAAAHRSRFRVRCDSGWSSRCCSAVLWGAGLPQWALISAAVLVGYHLLAYDRVRWLLTGHSTEA
ncbi:hypothetical protein ATK86_7431 [Nocardia fluminea]|uniref:Uncharacterized protein n=1 Tax=Nocardia fluminea TaxID=134984 RepID=A0A2N3V4F5_9NOCA|nr:hypothetical protein ATK86_7431 [Nocardia fluminea]